MPAMAVTYVIGYSGTVVSRSRFLKWKHVTSMVPEFGRRVVALIDASILAGTPVGIGSSFRSHEGTESLFLQRHHVVEPNERGCCTYNGVRYALNKGMAHAAPPGRSYHEDNTTPDGVLAADLIGRLSFVTKNASKFGLKEFSKIGNEPWHVQPIEIPTPRRLFRLDRDMPLKTWDLPGAVPVVAPTPKVLAPKPTLAWKRRNDTAQVRELQAQCNFFGWRDAYGRELLVDGQLGALTDQAIRSMQRALGVLADGIYGPVTARALQKFLDLAARMAS